MESDWREILSLSQSELKDIDKDKLCESLAWMESDDIELNFTDLKTLFRLAQDILKYKNEQVNGLLGRLETRQRKSKTKKKQIKIGSHDQISDDEDKILRQEEIIKNNKKIIEQLSIDIAELENHKIVLNNQISKEEVESESSRNTLSEMNTISQLESEIFKRNKHIKKLMGDIKVFEEENLSLKEKTTTLKDKLKESTLLIENLTEQLFTMTKENNQMKDILGKTEKEKSDLAIEIETLKKENNDMDYKNEKAEEDFKSKILQYKYLLKSHKNEIEHLTDENLELKENLRQVSSMAKSSCKSSTTSSKEDYNQDGKIQELQEKLLEASEEILRSANVIQTLKTENRQLKSLIDKETCNLELDNKNESDDGKERNVINNLNKKIKTLTAALHGAEEMVSLREQEIAEITSQLQLLQTDEGVQELIKGIKNKKRELKIKDEGIKSLVSEVNNLNQFIDDLQLENIAMREKLNIPVTKKISTHGILKKYNEMKKNISKLTKNLEACENNIITLELENSEKKSLIEKLTKILQDLGWNEQSLDDSNTNVYNTNVGQIISRETLIEENEGLRKGLSEILNFLKDNSTSTSGTLALECPSLDALLQSMEARQLSGWFSPHMKTIMELRTAIGGRDALLTALHESRKETNDLIRQLTSQTNKSLDLEKQLAEYKSIKKEGKEFKDEICSTNDIKFCEIGAWMSEKEFEEIDITNKIDLDNLIVKGNILFENQLKHLLQHFQNKFTLLYNEFSSMTINITEQKSKWSHEEENYKAQIERLTQQVQENDDDPSSDRSPGLINSMNPSFLERRCSYLEEMYRQIRTLNENLKNEYLECKKENMLLTSEYEVKTHNLILSVFKLTDKLRNTIPLSVFMKQNKYLNELLLKHRQIVDNNANKYIESVDLIKRLDRDKLDLFSRLHQGINRTEYVAKEATNTKLATIEQTILKTQMKQILVELENKTKEVYTLRDKINELQDFQIKLLDKIQFSETNNDVHRLNDLLITLEEENKSYKEKCNHISTQLDIALLQLRSNEQNVTSNNIELNMLRHQILDLQSNGNNNTIIARLSGEILLAQLQSSESLHTIDILKVNLNKEKELRTDVEKQLLNYQKVFELNTIKYENKIRALYEEINLLREQYQGCLPLMSIENFIITLDDINHKNYAVNEKLSEIEDLRSDFIRKNCAYEQILDICRNTCIEDGENCSHRLKNILNDSIQSTELEYHKEKIKTIEKSHDALVVKYNNLEKKFYMLNQSFQTSHENKGLSSHSVLRNEHPILLLEDVKSDEDTSDGNETYTISDTEKNKDIRMKHSHYKDKTTAVDNTTLKNEKTIENTAKNNIIDKGIQVFKITSTKEIQTDCDKNIAELTSRLNMITSENNQIEKRLIHYQKISQQRAEELNLLKKEKDELGVKIKYLSDACNSKDSINTNLQTSLDNLRKQLDDLKASQLEECKNYKSKENQIFVENLKKMDADKNTILTEYKELLNTERENFRKTMKDFQEKIFDLQTKLEQSENRENASSDSDFKENLSKYTSKIVDLEDKCFKLERNLEDNFSELNAREDELDRWKKLAAERLAKIEQLSMQSKDRHNEEMESYKLENEHWIAQLNETQRDQMEMRNKLAEQKTMHFKQISEKDSQIEQLRFTINNLKTQIMNMQTMFSLSDPNFDLSAIVEVDEVSDGISQQDSDKLEIKFESTIDFDDTTDNLVKIPSSSTMIWHEPLIERLRREKQLISKQNAMLRRQIKALAGRERRARLDAQNLKNQVFRITTNGSKVPSAECAALQSKIASLQAQLGSVRRESHSNVAIWDKWKRSQQACERWQVKYDDKCHEVNKLEASLNLAKSAVSRLEKEKRILLTSLSEMKQKYQYGISEERNVGEKQDDEKAEKLQLSYSEASNSPPVSTQALLARIAAQQRRIVALEVAERGNEPLIQEYEKSLAEITSLKGQVLKLESTLLEAQIRSPVTPTQNHEPELTYWKNYCDMLKEENMQLTLRLNTCENVPTTTHQQRINDLEQTVLTLRGLVNKLQSGQKSTTSSHHRRMEYNPGGRCHPDKIRNQIETYRIEIANVKHTLQEKDLLLEKSKEMLKIAAEREEELLRENSFLHHQLQTITENRGGFLSA